MAKAYTNQHIVPQSYLKRFGIRSGDKTIIGTRIKKDKQFKFIYQSIENVGYIKNFYDVTDKEDPKYWEHFFGNEIEPLYGRAMNNIIAKVLLSQNNTTVLSAYDKEVLSKIIVAQLLRIPDSIDYVEKQIYPTISRQVKEAFLSTFPQSQSDQIQNIEFSKPKIKELLLNKSFANENFKRYCHILQEGFWLVFVNTQCDLFPFATSDNPVLVESIYSGSKTGLFDNGLANPYTTIFYPLSPTIAIAIYSRQGLFAPVADIYDGKRMALDDVKFILYKNSKIFEQAYQYSFLPQPLFESVTNPDLYIKPEGENE